MKKSEERKVSEKFGKCVREKRGFFLSMELNTAKSKVLSSHRHIWLCQSPSYVICSLDL